MSIGKKTIKAIIAVVLAVGIFSTVAMASGTTRTVQLSRPGFITSGWTASKYNQAFGQGCNLCRSQYGQGLVYIRVYANTTQSTSGRVTGWSDTLPAYDIGQEYPTVIDGYTPSYSGGRYFQVALENLDGYLKSPGATGVVCLPGEGVLSVDDEYLTFGDEKLAAVVK